MAVSRTEAQREGMKGRGWTLLHTFGDLLWQMGDKSPPNEGFTSSRIFPLAAPEGEAPGAAAASAAAAAGEEGAGAGAGGEAGAAGEAAQRLGGLQLGAEGGTADGSSGGGGGGSTGAAAAAEGNGGGSGSAAPAGGAGGAGAGADMDALLEAAVLAGLQTLKNADLPIQAGDFYTKHMLAARPEGEGDG